MEKILGLWSGHDCSFCVLNDGGVEQHTEMERHSRVKADHGDAIQLFYDQHGDENDIVALTTCFQPSGIQAHAASWERISRLNVPFYVCGHHQAHAAHAFYSSRFNDAVVITLDGGGIENAEGFTVSVTIWQGAGTKLNHIASIPAHQLNLGAVWSRLTRYVFRCESGWPQGHQAGTVMALAALGKSDRYLPEFRKFFGEHFHVVDVHPPGHVKGMSAKDPRCPKHPFLERWASVARSDERAMFDMALALQLATDEKIEEIVRFVLSNVPNVRNVCFSGGVALNSVSMGKMLQLFPSMQFYVPPVPYDGGLTIGAAQHVWHHVLGRPRIDWSERNASPYLGKQYSHLDVCEAIRRAFVATEDVRDRKWVSMFANDDTVIAQLLEGKVISVFNGRAESGRRALGNRSIIADPRDPSMKDRVNERVKHRQWWRPFAPSITLEAVENVFETFVESPYMSFVVRFKPEAAAALPAVVHFDGTARLQTVMANDAPWYHSFLCKWEKASGWPVLLNSSLNDTTPICETPDHAMQCFLGTDIDVLYFPEHQLAVRKTER